MNDGPRAAAGSWLSRVSIERQVYATVVLMSVLVVYDGWQQLTSFVGVALVIVAPILALAIAHLFSEGLQEYADQQRPLTRREWLDVARRQGDVLLSAVPALLVTGLGWLSPLTPRSTITVLLWTGMLTLAGLTALAARRAGAAPGRQLVAALAGGLLGMLVISLQVLLKPH